MIKLTYRPSERTAAGESMPQLAFVGKGIMYDSGGIALKPGDAVHAQMKNDMSGAAAILAAMLQLRDLGCTDGGDRLPDVHQFDARPAPPWRMGDVITHRDGTTVEVVNTDAEGRLVMADALVLARETGADAIVDIATLTGAMMRALGRDMAGRHRQPRRPGGRGARGGRRDRGAGLAHAPLAAVRAPARLHRRGPEEPGLGRRRCHHGRPVPGALRGRCAVGAPGHRGRRVVGRRPGDPGRAGCTGFGARLLLQLALDFSPPAEDRRRMTAATAPAPKESGGLLDIIEKVGNKVPHPVLMFLYLIIGVIVASAILAFLGVSVTDQIAVPIPVVAGPGLRGWRHEPGVRGSGYGPDTHFEIEQTTIAIQSLISIDGHPVHVQLVREQLHRLLRGGCDVHRAAGRGRRRGRRAHGLAHPDAGPGVAHQAAVVHPDPGRRALVGAPRTRAT